MDEEEYQSTVKEWLNLHVGGERRYSAVLVKQLVAGGMARKLNVHAVYDVVAMLEGKPSRAAPTKPEAPFKKVPLLGLWHKHFFQASFITNNLINQWERDKVFPNLTSRFSVGSNISDKANELVHMLTMEAFDNRSREKSLTGEWLVFAKHEGQNYYLTLGVHRDDENTKANVDSCIVEFPWLSEVLKLNEA